MRLNLRPVLTLLLLAAAVTCFAQSANSADEAALDKTDAAVRAGFAGGDLDAIRLYHDPML